MILNQKQIDIIELVFQINKYLEGSYSPKEIKYWFERKHAQLDNKTPSQVLIENNYDRNNAAVKEVIILAKSAEAGNSS